MYDFDYEDEVDEMELDATVENKYFYAKGCYSFHPYVTTTDLRIEDPETALREFREVVDMENDKTEW